MRTEDVWKSHVSNHPAVVPPTIDPAPNNNGRLVTVNDGGNTETYTYDLLGRVTNAAKVIGGTSYSVGYGYNLAGEVTSLSYPSGRVVQQTYDPIGRLTTIFSGATNYASSFAYNPAGQVTGFNYGNGVTAAFGYSPERLLLQTVSYAKATQTLFSLSYGYAHPNGGRNGQITNVTDNMDSGRTVNYTYDALYRASTAATTGSASYPQWGLAWSYDRYGNRTNQTVTAGTAPSNSLSISATSNRITSTGFTYDSNGNLTQEGSASLQYKYDGEDQLVDFQNGGASYTFDGMGLRIKKVTGGNTTVYVFSGSLPLAEYVNGTLNKEYIYAGDQLLATYDAGTLRYHHPDHLSVRLNTDAAGNVAGQQGHYPFGESWYASNSTTKWQFTSYERDGESGLDYAINRYHSTRVGRFTSPDLLAGEVIDPQSLNRYPYVENDPINLTDPLGLVTIRISIGGGGGGGGFCGLWGGPGGDLCILRLLPISIDDLDDAGGGGGGSSFQRGDVQVTATNPGFSTEVEAILRLLRELLLRDPKCLAFLNKQGIDVLKNIDFGLKHRSVGVADLDPETVNATGGGAVEGQSITINRKGAFFNNKAATNNGKIRGGTPKAQKFILLHELGHSTDALSHDNDPKLTREENEKNERKNNKDIGRECKQTINTK